MIQILGINFSIFYKIFLVADVKGIKEIYSKILEIIGQSAKMQCGYG